MVCVRPLLVVRGREGVGFCRRHVDGGDGVAVKGQEFGSANCHMTQISETVERNGRVSTESTHCQI